MTTCHVAGPILFLFLFLSKILFSSSGNAQQLCPAPSTCGKDGPPVRFPFALRGRSEGCGYPGFELTCSSSGNQTILDLPRSGQFLVTSINYKIQEIHVGDPGGCLFRRLESLNVSGSPFGDGASQTIKYTIVNCSSEAAGQSMRPIDCLSSGSNRVYGAAPYYPMDSALANCSWVANIVIPSDADISADEKLILRWDTPACGHCERKGTRCGFTTNNTLHIACFSLPPDSDQGKLRVGLIAGISSSILVAALAGIAMMLYLKVKRDRADKDWHKIEKILEDSKALYPCRYSYAEVKKMTSQFKKKLGEGGFGSVFRGSLPNGVPVAVKILNDSEGNGQDFINEVSTIGRIHHVNVVRLLGFCIEGQERALVYEYMPNKSLDRFILPKNPKAQKLGWDKLQDIAIGVARGVEYIHYGCDQTILHFDIKPQNVLLDINLNPKISDFGLAKLTPRKESIVPLTAARGTMGYIAPEVYFSRNMGNVSHKSDVYSFGMLLLGMVGGRKRDVLDPSEGETFLPEWLYQCLNKGEDMGVEVGKEGDAEIVKKLTIVAFWCIQWYPVKRPSIKVVVQMLEGKMDSLSMPPNPFASPVTVDANVIVL